MFRDGMNMHLGDALNHVERALGANQGERESLLGEAQEIIDYVLKEEVRSEYR